MKKLGETKYFAEKRDIILEGFDPVSAGGFTQVPNFIIKNGELSSNAKVAYSILLSYAWTKDSAFPGQERMAEDMGLSQQSVSRAIIELQDVGYLEVGRRGQGKTNIYILRHTVKVKGKK